MLSEAFKKKAFDDLDSMSGKELEDTLIKIGSVPWSDCQKSKKIYRIDKYDIFLAMFNALMMELHSHCSIEKEYVIEDQKLCVCTQYFIQKIGDNHYDVQRDTRHIYLNGDSLNHSFVTREYYKDGLLEEIFDSFEEDSIIFKLEGMGKIYMGTDNFIEDVNRCRRQW